MSDAEMREAILKANPGLALAFFSELNEWAMIHPFSSSINLVEELGTYTLTPNKTLPETEDFPNLKQIVINGRRICFVVRL